MAVKNRRTIFGRGLQYISNLVLLQLYKIGMMLMFIACACVCVRACVFSTVSVLTCKEGGIWREQASLCYRNYAANCYSPHHDGVAST